MKVTIINSAEYKYKLVGRKAISPLLESLKLDLDHVATSVHEVSLDKFNLRQCSAFFISIIQLDPLSFVCSLVYSLVHYILHSLRLLFNHTTLTNENIEFLKWYLSLALVNFLQPTDMFATIYCVW